MGAFLRIIQKLAHSYRLVGGFENPEGRAVIQDLFIKKLHISKNGCGVLVATRPPPLPDSDGPEV